MPVTANSFVLVNSDPIKVTQLDAALHYLQTNSPDLAMRLLEQAAENQVRIVFSDPVVNTEDGYGENSHSIVWDPTSGLVVLDRPNGTPIGVESAANGLIHEIAHSLEINQAERHNDQTHPNAQYDNDSEATATMYANAVARDCGEPARPDYASARDIRVSNPTAHTERGANGSQVWSQDNTVGGEETGPRYEPNGPAPTFGSNGANGGAWGGNEHDYDPGNEHDYDPGAGNEHDYDPGNYAGNEHDNDPGGFGGDGGGFGGGSGGINGDDEGQVVQCITIGTIPDPQSVQIAQTGLDEFLWLLGGQQSSPNLSFAAYVGDHGVTTADDGGVIIVGTAPPVVDHIMLF